MIKKLKVKLSALSQTVKSDKGFTLVEVMIAILVLALSSGFIAEMFLVSARVNQRAQDMDSGVMRAIGIIETFKKQETPLKIADDVIFENAYSGSESGILVLTGYYDENWQPLPASAGVLPEGAVFCLTTNIYEDTAVSPLQYSLALTPDGREAAEASVRGAVYGVRVEVIRLPDARAENQEPESLAVLDAQHYFDSIGNL